MDFIKKSSILLCLVLQGCMGLPEKQSGEDFQLNFTPSVDLEADFVSPPDYAKPWVYWWWLEGYITRQGIVDDLAAMKDAGIAGAIIFDAGSSSYYNGRLTHSNSVMRTQAGPGFMTDAWRDLFSFSCKVADSLGLTLSLSITSGWNDGGPWVTPEYASQKLVWSEITVEGGQAIEQQLPLPNKLMKYTGSDKPYFKPVAVLAVKLSPEADSVKPLPRLDIKAVHAISIPQTPNRLGYDWEVFVRPLPGELTGCHARLNDVTDISSQVDEDGNLKWDAPPGRYAVLRFGHTGTGVKVSTHSPGAGGLAIDYMNVGATDLQFEHVVIPLLEDLKHSGSHALAYLHDDSWELGAANWTPLMEKAFADANGYGIRKYLPVIAGKIIENHDLSERFLYDFRRTIADLILQNHYRKFKELSHQRGLGIHPESGGPHPAPIDALKNMGESDIVMGEFWIRATTHRVEPHSRLYIKQGASAAHIYGKRFMQAEGPTGIGSHWEEDFAYMKPTFDRVYCEGLNRFVIHTFTHSPEEAGIPGNEYFAGTHFNPNVTWWKQAPAFLTWNSRISFMLSQGLFVGDVCYYYGDNVPNQVPLKHVHEGLGEGYDYDVCNTDVILNRMTARNGKIYLPDGMSYEVLVLPDRTGITPEVMTKIAQLVKNGATVIGAKPVTSVGLRGDKKAREKVRKTADDVWGNNAENIGKRSYGKGYVYTGISVRETLLSKGVQPDFAYESRKPDALIDYIHRQTPEADIYYVANRNKRPEYIRASFRVEGKTPELWYPETGQTVSQSVYTSADGQTALPLMLEPFGSVFVVFRKPQAAHYENISLNGNSLFPALPQDTFVQAPFIPYPNGKLLFTLPGKYALTASSGEIQQIAVEPVRHIPVSNPWNVAFDPALGGPEHVRLDNLIRWDTHSDPGIRYYSGTAEYTNTFEIMPEQYNGKQVYLDLGEMYNVAEVYINGQSAGIWWQPPFSHDITNLLRDGENSLRIKVVNLWPNRLVGDAQLPEDKRLTRTNVVKFTKDTPLLPSG
ncbi:MAG: glycoside hydrolase family 2, partial [Tannerella sp.]|nr:glycoside hydrolase family 2 [Tannerella sp.]